MNQDQLKEQFLQYAEDNLHNDTILQSITELLENIINDICYEYPHESNRLTTAELIIKEVMDQWI